MRGAGAEHGARALGLKNIHGSHVAGNDLCAIDTEFIQQQRYALKEQGGIPDPARTSPTTTGTCTRNCARRLTFELDPGPTTERLGTRRRLRDAA